MKIVNNDNQYSPTLIAKVAIEGADYYFDKLYDYIVPIEMKDEIFIGQRIIVPFGKGNKKKIGLILNIKEYGINELFPYFLEKGLAIKPVLNIIDKQKIISDEIIKIIFWLKKRTFCCYFDAYKLMVPSGYNIDLIMKYKINKTTLEKEYKNLNEDEIMLINILRSEADKKEKVSHLLIENLTQSQKLTLKKLINKNIISEREVFKRKIQDNKLVMVKLSENFGDLADNVELVSKLTQKQKKVVNFLKESESASLKEVLYMCGVTKAVLDNLINKNLIKYFEVEVYRTPYKAENGDVKQEIKLNIDQENILKKLVNLIDQNKPNMALIRGVTGSGKTLIFINLIKYVISQNKNVILLVPEISLTPQMIKTLEDYFGNLVAVLHSGLTLASRLDEWKRIKNGDAKIVLGTRSAIFAPFDNIGLIIMDEEQEASYKSESAPRYHTKDIAKLRALYNKTLFLMASATPSVLTYYQMKKNNFDIFKLDSRYSGKLPLISIVDMKKERQKGNNLFFSEELILAVEDNLSKNKQSIIFINRRGYNTFIRCEECGNVETCPNCSTALTYHKANNRLMCHYCGYSRDVIKRCSKCGSVYLRYSGAGTQKIEDQLEEIFPKARILRLDSDNTTNRFSYDTYFQKFLNHENDILIGTQMIAKGLNFPEVTLVGVIDADRSIYSSDYKGLERTYDIITQVIGRSGRSSDDGRAIIQTSSSENNIFNLIVNQRYEDFYNEEIFARKKLLYPPFCDMTVIGLIGSNENVIIKIGNEIFEFIKNLIFNEYKDVNIKMFGPVSEVISKINNKYRYKIFIKHKDDKRFRQMIDFILKSFMREKQKYGVNIFIDKI